ncbi:hypothetical protein PMZ80_001979 [Knufia obscura]|uniref:F-box domain-containing protein n=2 Tax=Knufia TaxID=430999 RepID=A0AAN8IN27_9EURO|nr:hypothetical protein PMZ80_001979 [Knufia obscura]KAK5953797.1 hypothetical protein OHC33_005066 [Knufia fluminis]
MSSNNDHATQPATLVLIPSCTNTEHASVTTVSDTPGVHPDTKPDENDTEVVTFNNNRLPDEVLGILMEHVLSNTTRGTCFNLSALLTCQSWYRIGSQILWRAVVHRQYGRVDCTRTAQLTNVIHRSQRAKGMLQNLTITVASAQLADQMTSTDVVSEDSSDVSNYEDDPADDFDDHSDDDLSDDEYDWPPPPKHKIQDLLAAVLHLKQLHTLSVDLGQGLLQEQAAAALQTLNTALPPTLQNLNVKFLGSERAGFNLSMQRGYLSVWSIDVVAQRLKNLRLELPFLGLNRILPSSWSGYYPELEEFAIIVDGSEVSCGQAWRCHTSFDCIWAVSNSIETGIADGRFPNLRVGTISGAYATKHYHLNLEPSLSEVARRPQDIIFFRSFNQPPHDTGSSYALLRLTPDHNVFWAQFTLSWKRYKALSKRRHFSYFKKRRLNTGVPYAVVQVVDELSEILHMVRKGTWTELASGTFLPTPMLESLEGRRYKRDKQPIKTTRPDKSSAAKKHHEELMAKVAKYPDMVKFVNAQANGTANRLKPRTWTSRKALY